MFKSQFGPHLAYLWRQASLGQVQGWPRMRLLVIVVSTAVPVASLWDYINFSPQALAGSIGFLNGACVCSRQQTLSFLTGLGHLHTLPSLHHSHQLEFYSLLCKFRRSQSAEACQSRKPVPATVLWAFNLPTKGPACQHDMSYELTNTQA